jgi:hypothetical protein
MGVAIGPGLTRRALSELRRGGDRDGPPLQPRRAPGDRGAIGAQHDRHDARALRSRGLSHDWSAGVMRPTHPSRTTGSPERSRDGTVSTRPAISSTHGMLAAAYDARHEAGARAPSVASGLVRLTGPGVLPVLCPGCRSPVPPDTPKCVWCGRNVNQGGGDTTSDVPRCSDPGRLSLKLSGRDGMPRPWWHPPGDVDLEPARSTIQRGGEPSFRAHAPSSGCPDRRPTDLPTSRRMTPSATS